MAAKIRRRPLRRVVIFACAGMAMIVAAFSIGTIGRHGGAPRYHAPMVREDAYVWQRRWTPAVRAAIADDVASVGTWHVLAAELDGDGGWRDSHTGSPPAVLATRPVIAVFRIDGQVARWSNAAAFRHIAARVEGLRQLGLHVTAVEIDHDCPTSRLRDYAAFLSQLRTTLAGRSALWITALPSWMGSADLETTLAQADEVVLQVHAVQNPALGMFDSARAGEWMTRFARRVRTPWHVALPAYGSRVAWSDDGRLAMVESETSRLLGNAAGAELIADPRDVDRLMRRTQRSPPSGFAGWVWFRLPVGDDRRAWSPQTWLTIVGRRPVRVEIGAEARERAPGLYDIVITNTGSVDTPLPHAVRVLGPCAGIGSSVDYVVQYDATGPWLSRSRLRLLAAGAQAGTGWARCERGRPGIHVEP